jgi:hypothetical protein
MSWLQTVCVIAFLAGASPPASPPRKCRTIAHIATNHAHWIFAGSPRYFQNLLFEAAGWQAPILPRTFGMEGGEFDRVSNSSTITHTAAKDNRWSYRCFRR